jgi:hypothetical protein
MNNKTIIIIKKKTNNNKFGEDVGKKGTLIYCW